MSNGEQQSKRSEVEILQQEIVRLRKEQVAAELIATRAGMTPVDSEQYKMRHFRIRVLTKRLAMLNRKQADTDALVKKSFKPSRGGF